MQIFANMRYLIIVSILIIPQVPMSTFTKFPFIFFFLNMYVVYILSGFIYFLNLNLKSNSKSNMSYEEVLRSYLF